MAWGCGGETVEATGWTLDVAGVEEVAEGALDLEEAGVWEVIVKSGNGDSFGRCGDES